jgi:hypothetical protein
MLDTMLPAGLIRALGVFALRGLRFQLGMSSEQKAKRFGRLSILIGGGLSFFVLIAYWSSGGGTDRVWAVLAPGWWIIDYPSPHDFFVTVFGLGLNAIIYGIVIYAIISISVQFFSRRKFP